MAISQGEEGCIPSSCHEISQAGFINLFKYHISTFGCNFYKFENKGRPINHLTDLSLCGKTEMIFWFKQKFCYYLIMLVLDEFCI